MMSKVPKEAVINAKWRMKALESGASDPAAAHFLREMCKKDILFWFDTFAWTYDPRRKDRMVPFITYPYQEEAILKIKEAVEQGHDVVIEKSRDMGASWILIGAITWFFQFTNLFSSLMVSRNEDYVDAPNDPKSLFWKVDFLLEHQPRWLAPKQIKRTSMHIGNGEFGSVIDGESTTGEVGRGDRRSVVFLDEFGSFELKAGFNALASTRDTTNCRLINSTPKGTGNAFYKMVKESSAEIIRMHWSQHPTKARGLYTSEAGDGGKMVLKMLSDWKGIVTVRRRGERTTKRVAFPEDYPFILDGKLRSPWYDDQCSRAATEQEIAQELDIDYTGSDFQFFSPDAIEKYKALWCKDPEAVGDMEIDPNDCKVLRFTPNRKGKFRLWEMPKSEGKWDVARRFVIGADVSAGTGASNSTLCVYDEMSREKVAEYADPTKLPDDFGRFAAAVARWFNNAIIVPDRSGPTGEVFTRRLVAQGYRNIYRAKDEKKIGSPSEEKYGVWLNPALRTTILENYRDSIGRNYIINRSEIAMNEASKFIRKADGTIEHTDAANSIDPSGAKSNHGDLCIGDALANLRLCETENRERAEEPEIPKDSMKYRMSLEEIEKQNKERELGEGWEV